MLPAAGYRCAMKTGRNEPCPCGSGQKFKRCCIEQSTLAAPATTATATVAEPPRPLRTNTWVPLQQLPAERPPSRMSRKRP